MNVPACVFASLAGFFTYSSVSCSNSNSLLLASFVYVAVSPIYFPSNKFTPYIQLVWADFHVRRVDGGDIPLNVIEFSSLHRTRKYDEQGSQDVFKGKKHKRWMVQMMK